MEQKIIQWLEDLFTKEEWVDFFLVEIKYHPSNAKIIVYVDADQGLTLDRCKTISRYLEAFLDQEQEISEKYILEVSSPDLERPLKKLRQYHKNVGRELEVVLKEGEKKRGTLTAVNDDGIVLSFKEKKEEKNNKYSFEEISKAFVQVKFN